MKKIDYIFALILIHTLFVGCGEEKTPVLPEPGEFGLIAPAENSACLKGKSESEQGSVVDFSWSQSSDAENYILEITDLVSKETRIFTTSSASYSSSLAVNNYYSWKVIAINPQGELESAVWKFYLSGTPESNYAPFPAELVTPVSGSQLHSNGEEKVLVSFSWIGSDVDDDIENYTFFIDNKDASTQADVTTEESIEVELQRGEFYYWKVLTTDIAGNTSTSGLGWFIID